MVTHIVDCTNIYISKIHPQFVRERDARHTNSREVCVVIGVLCLAGVLKAGRRNIKLFEMWDYSQGCLSNHEHKAILFYFTSGIRQPTK